MELLPVPDKSLVHQNDLKDYKIDRAQREALAQPIEKEMISSMITFIKEIIRCLKTEKAK